MIIEKYRNVRSSKCLPKIYVIDGELGVLVGHSFVSDRGKMSSSVTPSLSNYLTSYTVSQPFVVLKPRSLKFKESES